MRVRSLLGVAFGSILFAACSGTAEEGAPSPASNGHLRGMARYHGADALPAAPPTPDINPTCKTPKLSYFGGPILQTPIVVAVFWNSKVNAELQTNMEQFYTDVTQSTYWTGLQEYDTVGLAGGTNQAILPGTGGGSVVLSPVVCPATSTGTCKLTDAELQTELVRQIGLGTLPAPELDCTGNVRTIYMVSFPPNISLTAPGGSGTSCVQFCAYHYTGTYGANKTPLIYGALMDEYTGGCSAGCGNNGTPLANSTDTASHELAEATTDPDIGLDTQGPYAAPAGWGDNNNQCGEIGDICDGPGDGASITVSGRTWVVQQLWSNAQGKCTSAGPVVPVCSGTTVTNCRACSCGDNGNACTGGTPVCETTKTNVLFGGCEQCTSTSGNCPVTFSCQESATPAQDDICNGSCLPNLCPAPDNCGTLPDGCGGMISCGAGCTAAQTCVANICVDNAVDAGLGADAGIDAGDGADAGIDGDIDAGVDAGSGDTDAAGGDVDAGTVDDGGAGDQDAGASMDAGIADDDSGDVGDDDSGTTDEDSGGLLPIDSGVAHDAGATHKLDAGATHKLDAGVKADASADGGDETGNTGSNSGCGCKVAETNSGAPSPALLGFGALAAGLGARIRRRRR